MTQVKQSTDFMLDLNDSLNNSSRDWLKEDFIRYYNTGTIIFLFVLMILSFLLNFISIICILYTNKFTVINMLILNLSVSDILYACCIPLFAKQFTGGEVYQTEFGCRISYLLDVTCMIVSFVLIFKKNLIFP